MTTIQCERTAGPAIPVGSPDQRPRLPRLSWLSWLSWLLSLPRHRILAFAFTGCALVMLPWLVVLGFELPSTAEAPHWNVAWVGLDAMEAIGLFATGLLLARGDRRYAVTAALTGTALLTDAWFDLLTSSSSDDLLIAIAMAVIIELPLAAGCFFLALRATTASGSVNSHGTCR